MAEGVDFSWDRPSPLCLWSLGKTFAVRYFGPGSAEKHATRTEVTALLASGLSVVCNAEGVINAALNGYGQGVSHAQSALAGMRAAGIPDDRPCYFSVDFDMVSSQHAAVEDYFAGVQSVIGWNRTGIYGGYRTVSWAYDNNWANWFWQTYAWSQGNWSIHNHLEQYKNAQTVCGGDVDLCRSKRADFGQHPAPDPELAAVIDQAPPVVSAGPWDYTGDIQGTADDVLGLATGLGGFTRNLQWLRDNS